MPRLSRNLLDLTSLFASKTGGLLVALLLLPLISHELGPAQFGVVTVIIAAQTFFTVADLGVSAYLTREMAVPGAQHAALLSDWRAAERLLVLAFALLGAVSTMAALSKSSMSPHVATAGGAAVLVALTVLQNVAYSCLVARRDFIASSATQSIFVVLRAGLTLLGLKYLSSSVEMFLLIQIGVLTVHLMVSRWLLHRSLTHATASGDVSSPHSTIHLRQIFRAVKPLALAGIAGASVTQIDKPLIATLVSPAAVSFYFLAYSLCSTPAGILAGPVAQFFQPRMVALLSQGGPTDQTRGVRNFCLTLAGLVALPALAMWLFRGHLVDLWLPYGQDNPLISQYASVLLPAFAIGALGYVPVILLLSIGDYRFHARASTVLAAIALVMIYLASRIARIDLVCWSYAVFFLLSYIVYMGRALTLSTTRHMARTALGVQLLTSAPLVGLGWLIQAVSS